MMNTDNLIKTHAGMILAQDNFSWLNVEDDAQRIDNEIAEFKDYFHAFYTANDEGEILYDFLTTRGYTTQDFDTYFNIMKLMIANKDHNWGGGDTFDRERLRDIVLFHGYGIKNEYNVDYPYISANIA